MLATIGVDGRDSNLATLTRTALSNSEEGRPGALPRVKRSLMSMSLSFAVSTFCAFMESTKTGSDSHGLICASA
jgi:hypothetical protein